MADTYYEPNITCLFNQLTTKKGGFYDMFNPCFIKGNFQLETFVVGIEHEMRIDLIMKEMYGNDLAGPEVMQNADIILFINEIDNPLNIKRGMILYYPESGEFEKYRISEEYSKITSQDKTASRNKLAVPNKTNTKDPAREAFKSNNYLLPPTAQPFPKEPVRITSDGKFSMGGI